MVRESLSQQYVSDKKFLLRRPRWVRSPEEREQLKDGSPSFVVEHLLGHESAGSLRSALVRRGWANTVTATVQNDDSDLQACSLRPLRPYLFVSSFNCLRLLFRNLLCKWI